MVREGATVTQALKQSEQKLSNKSMKVAAVTDPLPMTREKFIQLKEEDSPLSKYMMKKGAPIRNGKGSSHVKQKGVMYRLTKKIGAEKEKIKQILFQETSRKYQGKKW